MPDRPITAPILSAIRAELDRGFTVTGLAERCGVPRPNLSRFIAGDKAITNETADRIALALGLEVRMKRTRDNPACCGKE